jgi:hypothetical protein
MNLPRGNEVLQRVSEERDILRTIRRRKDKWIDHILLRNCLLKHETRKEI